jgi:hypothetical protein
VNPHVRETALKSKLDLFDYHDLTTRLAAFAVDGGRLLRGNPDVLAIIDAEPVMAAGESERLRLAGTVRLIGPRSTRSVATPELGRVLEGVGVLVVTTHRLIVMASQGVSQLGPIAHEAHCFVLPMDLIDSISIPARKSVVERISGARTITVASLLTAVLLELVPAPKAEIAGRPRPIGDDEAMRLLVHAVVTHRMSVSRVEDAARLRAVRDGRYNLEDGTLTAVVTPDETRDVPPHLIGRLVGHRSARRDARDRATLLLG